MADLQQLFRQATGLLQQGQSDKAEPLLRKALKMAPDTPELLGMLGKIYGQQGRHEDALSCFTRITEIQPDNAIAHFNLGNALRETGRTGDAVTAFRRAVDLAPDVAQPYNGLGSALQASGDLAGAAEAFRRAITLGPRFADAHNNLGTVLRGQGRLHDAESSYRHALSLQPGHPGAANNLANLLADRGDLEEAVGMLRGLITANPRHGEAHYNLGSALVEQGNLSGGERHFREAARLMPSDGRPRRNLLFTACYNPDHSPETLRALHEEQAGMLLDQLGARFTTWDNPPDPERTLTIGYLSPDFRRHPVAYFLLPVLAAHNHKRFRIACYANLSQPDAFTEAIRTHADLWREVSGLPDPALAEQIRVDGVDILVELAGHTGNSRIDVTAITPAPVQVSYLGYPATTGLATMDYRITDERADPPGADDWYTEKLVRLPHGFFTYLPPGDAPGEVGAEAPEVSPLPAAESGRVTFGCLLNLAKINTATVALWARVLKALPEARLLVCRNSLKSGETRARYRELFADGGLPEDRYAFRWEYPDGTSPLSFYHDVDIVLDTLPFCGHTSTCEALWMGVPVITLAGKLFAGRMGVSTMHLAGLPELVAESEEEYVARAVDLASDPEALAGLRRGLRERITTSAMCDPDAFTRGLEAAYRTMWRDWCAARNG